MPCVFDEGVIAEQPVRATSAGATGVSPVGEVGRQKTEDSRLRQVATFDSRQVVSRSPLSAVARPLSDTSRRARCLLVIYCAFLATGSLFGVESLTRTEV